MTGQAAQGAGAAPQGGGFSGGDWATVIQGVGQGASTGLQSAGQFQGTKEEAKELKRRTWADLLKNALRRDLAMYRADVGHQDEMSSMQGDALSQMARGFVDSLRGAQVRGR